MKELYYKYLDSVALRWTPTTQASERSRLKHLNLELIDNPQSIYLSLQRRNLKPYSIKTAFMRLCSFYGWLLKHKHRLGENIYLQFIQDHPNLFKNVYVSKKLELTPIDALDRIRKITDEETKQKAIQLYVSGMRYSESLTLHKQGAGWYVKGKRELTRRVFLPDSLATISFSKDKSTFYRTLKSIGLTAHMLRKYAATNAIRNGADIPELLTIFGWSNAQTAIRYLQSKKEDQLDKLMKSSYDSVQR